MTEVKKRIAWTEEEDQILKEHYGKTDPWTLTQLIPNHSRNSMRNRATHLRNHGDPDIAEKQDKRKYEVNFSFFDNIGIEQCAFAGIVASDGCIQPKKNKIQITIKDHDYLEDWKNVLGFTGPIHVYKIPEGQRGKGNVSMLLLCGLPKWLQVLDKTFNITPRKSLTLMPPNILEREQVMSFILGYLDGDGSIMYKVTHNRDNGRDYPSWSVAFCGTQTMCYWFKSQCDRFYPPKKGYCGVEQNNQTKIWQYRIGGARAVQLLNDLLEIPVPHLQRKWQKFIDWKEQHTSS